MRSNRIRSRPEQAPPAAPLPTLGMTTPVGFIQAGRSDLRGRVELNA